MPQTCTICRHVDREAIDTALVNAEPLRNIAARFDLNASSVLRHKRKCLPAALGQAKAAVKVSQADTLLNQVEWLQQKALALLEKAESEADFRTALIALREARSCLEFKAKLLEAADIEKRLQAMEALALAQQPLPQPPYTAESEVTH